MKTLTSDYELLELIHEGKTTEIYRATSRQSGRSVVLKTLRSFYPVPEEVARLRQEYERTTNLQFEGVIVVHGLEWEEHRPVMVLEDFGGVSLDRITRNVRFSIEEFLVLSIKIASIIESVHEHQVIHKNINPSNMLLNSGAGLVKIIDFGIATLLPRESPALRSPHTIAGTLEYVSPEQTGRTNRAVDYRTDFYSLGVALYELVTGRLPFERGDALELVHAHLARLPTPPTKLNPGIPVTVSNIILKLMAKDAADRYQTASGLKSDLKRCLQEYRSTRQVGLFPLAERDYSDRLDLTQKLYGRDHEVESLLKAVENVSREDAIAEMMLVSGYSGIGKTAFIQEAIKPLTIRRGNFVSGKFDRFLRDVPYAALTQAFRSLARLILTGTDPEIEEWRHRLLDALGPNAQIVVEVIPELEVILGPQQPVSELPPAETRNRFNIAFQRFVRALCSYKHPLVVFLDDMQWADQASISLIQSLMTHSGIQNLLMIAAYRTNEVTASHPFLLGVDSIQKSGCKVGQMELAPLTKIDVSQMLTDGLQDRPEKIADLATVVHEKTEGNPFFVKEFIRVLCRDGMLKYAGPGSGWSWDVSKIRSMEKTENVITLMIHELKESSTQTRELLKLAACIGNSFDVATLSAALSKSHHLTALDLRQALHREWIIPLEETYRLVDSNIEDFPDLATSYKFAHDRIRQAAYSLVSESERRIIHERVGWLVLRGTKDPEHSDKIFDIANHLNHWIGKRRPVSQRRDMVRINLAAGLRAKSAGAFVPAHRYLSSGIRLIRRDDWDREFDLVLSLYEEAAEAALLVGNFDQMQEWSDTILRLSHSTLNTIKAREVQIQGYSAQNDQAAAIETGLEVLRQLGYEVNAAPDRSEIWKAAQDVDRALQRHSIPDLSNLPDMVDRERLAALRIYGCVVAVAYTRNPDLFAYLALKMVKTTIDHGISPMSIHVFSDYALLLCGAFGDVDAGNKFGQLARNLLEKFDARELQPRTQFIVSGFVRHWKEHMRETLASLQQAYNIGLETGDLTFSALAAFDYGFQLYWMGRPLPLVYQELSKYGEAIAQMNQGWVLNLNRMYQQVALDLMDQSGKDTRLSGTCYDVKEMLSIHQKTNDANALCQLHIHQMMLYYLFGEIEQAVKHRALAAKFLSGVTGTPAIPVYHLYSSLLDLSADTRPSEGQRQKIRESVTTSEEYLKQIAEHAPSNYRHKHLLVRAESARFCGENGVARELYDEAIDLARENEYLHEEALANELAADFYLSQGRRRNARHYLRDARFAWLHWGAHAKVKQFDQKYRGAIDREGGIQGIASISRPDGVQELETLAKLDLGSIVKSSQAISGEISMNGLSVKLMEIVLENAGAEIGFLLYKDDGDWYIEAEGKVSSKVVEVRRRTPASRVDSRNARVPISVLNYVAHTMESLVLNDASSDTIFSGDSYMQAKAPRSVLCAPIVFQGELQRIMYLENKLTDVAFGPSRLEVLGHLCAQAAVSIENARLYDDQVRLSDAASRFVPKEFFEFIGRQELSDVALGDHVEKEMAVLVADIRSFTSMSEKMTPGETFEFVNEFLRKMSPIIRARNGLVVKYIGDGLLAVFPKCIHDAIDAAIEMQAEVRRFNRMLAEQQKISIKIGVGIHTGSTMLGTVGDAERMQLDILSDSVNLCGRLEGLTKTYGTAIVVSEDGLNSLGGHGSYCTRFLGRVQVKGRQQATGVFEIIDGEAQDVQKLKEDTRARFEEGVRLLFQNRFEQAVSHFTAVLQHNPEDRAATLYLERIKAYRAAGGSIVWNGVEMSLEK